MQRLEQSSRNWGRDEASTAGEEQFSELVKLEY
jgi:hypothetical protein